MFSFRFLQKQKIVKDKLMRVNHFKWLIRGYPFSIYAKFSEKLTFLTPWYAHVRVRIRGLEILIFRKILRTHLMDDQLNDVRPMLHSPKNHSKQCRSIDWFLHEFSIALIWLNNALHQILLFLVCKALEFMISWIWFYYLILSQKLFWWT